MTMLDRYLNLVSIINRYKSSKGIKKIYYGLKVYYEKKELILSINEIKEYDLETLRNLIWMICNEQKILNTDIFIPDNVIINYIKDNNYFIKYSNNLISFEIRLFKEIISIFILAKINNGENITVDVEEEKLPGKNKRTDMVYDLLREIIIDSLDMALDIEIGGEINNG